DLFAFDPFVDGAIAVCRCGDGLGNAALAVVPQELQRLELGLHARARIGGVAEISLECICAGRRDEAVDAAIASAIDTFERDMVVAKQLGGDALQARDGLVSWR